MNIHSSIEIHVAAAKDEFDSIKSLPFLKGWRRGA